MAAENEVRAERAAENLAAHLDLALVQAEQIRADCEELEGALLPLGESAAERGLLAVAPLLRRKAGAAIRPLFELLERRGSAAVEPWPFFEALLSARDPQLARRALDGALRLAEGGRLRGGDAAWRFFAERGGADDSPFATPELLGAIGRFLAAPGEGTIPPAEAFTGTILSDGPLPVRRLAARLAELSGEPASAAMAEELLGEPVARRLREALEYTRAGPSDLLALRGDPALLPKLVESLAEAEGQLGGALFREVVAAIGWPRLNLGLRVISRIGLRVDGSFPLLASPDEARLLVRSLDARRSFEGHLVVAAGGWPATVGDDASTGPVARFRASNLAHAEALAHFLDVAPLTRGRVRRLLEIMAGIVDDFLALFGASWGEGERLREIHRELDRTIRAELAGEGEGPISSVDLARRVQMFEDPRTLDEVRTLHGLKRFLHQTGLRLAMGGIEAEGANPRNVDLLVVDRGRPGEPLRRIRYVDFEPDDPAKLPLPLLPDPVARLADGYARQLLAGQESFPDARLFRYGNEIHVYLGFRNHPAFLRIDDSPPLSGGMIDLEYYGISRYQLSDHPDPSLGALRALLEKLDFEVRIENTRVHARFDKERALDQATLLEKISAIFRLAPYLMDADWIVGDLDLPPAARARVREVWAGFFDRWGVLPMSRFLSADRRGIVAGIDSDATGERERLWDGEPPYRDRFRHGVPAPRLVSLGETLRREGLSGLLPPAWGAPADWGQLEVEQNLFEPLREALLRGELESEAEEGFRRRPADLFHREEAAELFADLLGGESPLSLAPTARLARLLAPLERNLRFRVVASVEGHEVGEAILPLPGGRIGLHVLRDAAGIPKLALWSEGEVLCRRRDRVELPWETNWSQDQAPLLARLRRAHALPPGIDLSAEVDRESLERIREEMRRGNPLRRSPPWPGERLAAGLPASAGRAVGPARLGTAGRRPEQFEGCIFFAPSIGPEDNAFLHRSAGIVATSGGILSHAGLIAQQFGRPAILVSGRWSRGEDGELALVVQTASWREERRTRGGLEVAIYRDFALREEPVREGDFAVLDADGGRLRLLGQERETLALARDFERLAWSARRLEGASLPAETLALRGERLEARHQVRRLLGRLTDPVLASHAVEEMLLGTAASAGLRPEEKGEALGRLLANPAVAAAAEEALAAAFGRLERRADSRLAEIRSLVPVSESPEEILSLRLEFLRLERLRLDAVSLLASCGRGGAKIDPSRIGEVDRLSARRLASLGAAALAELEGADPADPLLVHRLRRFARLRTVVPALPGEAARRLEAARSIVAAQESAAHADRFVLLPADCGLTLHRLVGGKAANLAEIERIAGAGRVPPWFVVTQEAFRRMLALPLEGDPVGPSAPVRSGTLLEVAIETIVARRDLDAARRSVLVRSLWERVALPADVAREIGAALEGLLGATAGGPSLLAVRSSSREEDSEAAARAGEFETFLFVRPEQLAQHLLRAWSGLWTERAIHNRALFGVPAAGVGGGLLVQRMVSSRVSGVLLTANAAEGNCREMLVDAGLGLGEGIVSGKVNADHVVVAREGDLSRGPLRFRYTTAEKREQMLFDGERGSGVRLRPVLHHQRLRPALEYPELLELVGLADRLERGFGHPLDIEFGIDRERLWILQARPLVRFLASLGETLSRAPLPTAFAEEEPPRTA